MAELDEQRNRLTVKLVYYGPALSGKTTNLTRLHDLLSAELIGDMMTLETEGDRTLFFDLLPVGFTAPSGLLLKFKVFTVPGQVVHDGTRKAVLSRADGIVFVADSQRNQAVNNGVSFENLMANAGALEGSGVIDTFAALLGRVYDRLDGLFSLEAAHQLPRATFIRAAGGGS